ncbi:MAG: acetyltransferase [Chitinophagaceae bacterium]|nr:MAG: acetyltransferase [Chitinophagaceae bacterium]
MNIEDYLNRIGYKGSLTPDLAVLKNLQTAHLYTVAFENLDIHYQNDIILDIDNFFQKIIIDKRGGFCYELNGLFQNLLLMIGYNAKLISARVYNEKDGNFGKEYDHLAIIVRIDEVEYLVDVGFGEFSLIPLKIELNTIQNDSRANYIIEAYKNDYLLISKLNGSGKKPIYIFTKTARKLSEFAEMCIYHQNNPNSHFTQKKIISKPTKNGRISIAGNVIKITENGKIVKETEFEEDTFEKYLKKWFNVVVFKKPGQNIHPS